MKKIVSESLLEFREKNNLNEGMFGSIGKGISKFAGTIKNMFRRIGKLFFPIIDGQLMINANTSVNVGIAVKNGLVNTNVINYVAGPDDIDIEPGLASLNEANFLKRFDAEEKKFDADEKKIANQMAKSIIDAVMSKNESKLQKAKARIIKEAMMPGNGKKSLNEADLLGLDFPELIPGQKANVKNVNRDEFMELLKVAIHSGQNGKMFINLIVWGAPGIGKTSIVKAMVAAKFGGPGKLVDLQTSKMRNDDWGLPYVKSREFSELEKKELLKAIETSKEKGVTSDTLSDEELQLLNKTQLRSQEAPKSWVPGYIPTGNKDLDAKLNAFYNGLNGGVLFLDELNRASQDVMATCLKLTFDRVVGEAILASKWVIIAAANRPGDDPTVSEEHAGILWNRFTQINYVPTFAEWKEWAYANNIDPNIMDFLEFYPQYFYYWDKDAAVHATPRLWHICSALTEQTLETAKMYGNKPSLRILKGMYTAAMGTDIGGKLLEFLTLQEKFDLKDIQKIFTTPEKAFRPPKDRISEAASYIAAVVQYTRKENKKRITAEEFKNFCTYLALLDEAPIAGAGLQMLVKSHPYINKGLGNLEGDIAQFVKTMDLTDEFKEGADIFTEKYRYSF